MGEVVIHPKASEQYFAPTPITEAHIVESFDCGKAPLNDWLRQHARKAEGRSARCYVVGIGQNVLGYYCLATGAVFHKEAPRTLRANLPNPTPVMVIGRLAVDRAYQGRGMGKGLLKDALSRTLQASKVVGARALIVHAIDAEAVPFYSGFGFHQFPTDMRTMFITMDEIAKAL
jgi:GNAT superfamily N-acetyltransferase